MTQEISNPFLAPAFVEPTMTIKNVTKHTLKFTLLEDGPAEVIRDESRWVSTGKLGDEQVHPPVLHGPKKVPMQKRERPIEIAPGQTIAIPRRFLHALVDVRCGVCATLNNPMGRCKHTDDPEHVKTWVAHGGRLVGFDQVQIDILAGVPVDHGVRVAAEENAKASHGNGWGTHFHRGADR